MADKVSPIPAGYHSVTPYLIVDGAEQAIDFYRKAFGAEEHLRLANPDGKLGHAEVKIGDSFVMLADEAPDWGAKGPAAYGGSPVHICLYVDDVDAIFAQAVEAGGEVVRPVQDQFYGDRSGTLKDPFGHQWTVCTHVEDLSQAEVEERYAAMLSGESP